MSLAGVVVIIIAAYYATYYIGVKASGQSRSRIRNRNINLIDRFAISRDKGFYLVEIAGKVYVIGVTNQSMTLIDTLDAAAFSEAAAERRDMGSKLVIPGGKFTNQIVTKLSSFMTEKTSNTRGDSKTPDSESFADSMKNAREKSTSGQPDNDQAHRSDDL